MTEKVVEGVNDVVEEQLDQSYSQALDWLQVPGHRELVGPRARQIWEEEQWPVDKPKIPFTPEEQAEVTRYAGLVVATLEARIGIEEVRDEETRQRALGQGAQMSSFLSLYGGTEGDDRRMIILGMGEVIEEAEQHPGTSADVVDLVTSLDLTQVDGSIRRLDRRLHRQQPLAPADELLVGAVDKYKSMRVLASINLPEVLVRIYEEFTATPQAPQ